MKVRIYQVDAFTDHVFGGNPAAVCPLERWLGDDILQNIAMENNLAETAFYVKLNDEYQIRWFTPTIEVDLCGHATLGAAYVLFNHEGHGADIVQFFSPRSGLLSVARKGELLTLNFPADVFEAMELSEEINDCFDVRPKSAFKGKTDYLLLFDTEDQIRRMNPRLDKISKLKARGVIVTAKGDKVDFVSRFFGPQSGVNEDPVTGSAHTTLIPYWSEVLGKTELTAMQLSPRKGHLQCRYLKDRVEIAGQGRLYMTGEIFLK